MIALLHLTRDRLTEGTEFAHAFEVEDKRWLRVIFHAETTLTIACFGSSEFWSMVIRDVAQLTGFIGRFDIRDLFQ